jgi:WD40 repeat protein
LLIGSNSVIKNYLAVINVALPTDESIIDHASYQEKPPNNNVGTIGLQNLNMKIFIPQNAEIMKARVNKCRENIIACKTGGSAH